MSTRRRSALEADDNNSMHVFAKRDAQASHQGRVSYSRMALVLGTTAMVATAMLVFTSPATLPQTEQAPASMQLRASATETTTTDRRMVDDNHAYFRPSGDAVSGFPTHNTAAYHRSPCPALNSLANHGYLPRDGKQLTPDVVKHAVMTVFHLDDSLATRLVATLPPTLTLAALGEHNFIEHDASMVHDDAFFKRDPSQMNATLVEALMARADGKQRLGKKQVAQFRNAREHECAASNPDYEFGIKRQATAYAEAAAFLLAMGDYMQESISVDHARSFLLEEKIPDTFERSKVPITTTHALIVAAKIKAMSWYS